MLTGGVLSLGSLVGFVTVLGIAARNGIMLVSHYRHLEKEEGEPFGRELVLRGAEERLAPILMTALATGLALLPLVIGGNMPGHEIEYPLAVVILGGLVTSTILNLFLMPALYLRYGKARYPHICRTATVRASTLDSALDLLDDRRLVWHNHLGYKRRDRAGGALACAACCENRPRKSAGIWRHHRVIDAINAPPVPA